MSVINKMLRDLDQRSSAGASTARATQGTVPVRSDVTRLNHPVWTLPAIGVLALLVLGAIAWYEFGGQSRVDSLAVPQVVLPLAPRMDASQSNVNEAPVHASDLLQVAQSPLPAVSERVLLAVPVPQAVGKHVVVNLSSVRSPSQLGAVAQPVLKPLVSVATNVQASNVDGLRMDLALEGPPVPVVKPVAETAELVTVSSAASQALAQAQSQWRNGSHAAAIDLLSRALTLVDGSAASGKASVETPLLANLARELARMQLAQGQVNQALTLLKRLEPQLADVAEVWAMRGNAEQRLGQHPQAVESYRHALTIKPDEPRWMLGQAVSLAAQGQTALAGALTEKARAQGALPLELANYLRQLGVKIRTD